MKEIIGVIFSIFFLISPVLGWIIERKEKKEALEVEERKRKEEEQKRLEEEQKKRMEEEQKRKEEERKAKEKAELLQKGRELYKQATAGEVIDEEIMQKAADLCDPNASLYVGVKMVSNSNIEGYTTSEIKDIYKRAKRYLRVASDANLPDGVFLYCNAVMMTESLQYSEAYDLLKSLRSVKKNELSKGLCDTYSSSLQKLVNLINDLEQKKEEEKERAMDRIRANGGCRYCKYHYKNEFYPAYGCCAYYNQYLQDYDNVCEAYERGPQVHPNVYV